MGVVIVVVITSKSKEDRKLDVNVETEADEDNDREYNGNDLEIQDTAGEHVDTIDASDDYVVEFYQRSYSAIQKLV